MLRSFSFLLLAFGCTSATWAENSTFAPGAFAGRYGLKLLGANGQEIRNFGGPTLALATIPESQGVALINSLGDPTFAATYCPGQQEKREFYGSGQAVGQYTHVGCTNGNTLFLRFRVGAEEGGIRPNANGGSAGMVRFTQIGDPAQPVMTGEASANSAPASFRVEMTHQGQGIPNVAPLSRVPPDYVLALPQSPSNPLPGIKVNAGATLNFNFSVRFLITSVKFGKLRASLLQDDKVLSTTETPQVTTLGPETYSPERTWGFNFPSVVVPPSGSLAIRVEMLSLPDGKVLSSTKSAEWAVFQAPPLTAAPSQLRLNRLVGATPQTDNLAISTTATAPLSYTASILKGSKWLTLSAPTGTVTGSGFIPFSLNPAGLAAGYYFDTVRVETTLGDLAIPVTLQVGPRPETVNVEPAGLRFDVRQQQGSPVAQTITLYHAASPGSSSPWQARVISGANLISLSSTSGTVQPETPATIAV